MEAGDERSAAHAALRADVTQRITERENGVSTTRRHRFVYELNLAFRDVSYLQYGERPDAPPTVLLNGTQYMPELGGHAFKLGEQELQEFVGIGSIPSVVPPDWEVVLQRAAQPGSSPQRFPDDVVLGIPVRRYRVDAHARGARWLLETVVTVLTRGGRKVRLAYIPYDPIMYPRNRYRLDLWIGNEDGFPYRLAIAMAGKDWRLDTVIESQPLAEPVAVSAPPVTQQWSESGCRGLIFLIWLAAPLTPALKLVDWLRRGGALAGWRRPSLRQRAVRGAALGVLTVLLVALVLRTARRGGAPTAAAFGPVAGRPVVRRSTTTSRSLGVLEWLLIHKSLANGLAVGAIAVYFGRRRSRRMSAAERQDWSQVIKAGDLPVDVRRMTSRGAAFYAAALVAFTVAQVILRSPLGRRPLTWRSLAKEATFPALMDVGAVWWTRWIEEMRQGREAALASQAAGKAPSPEATDLPR